MNENVKKWAEKLNGREYGGWNTLTMEEGEELKASGLVVVFGESDDLTEFRGAIDDEVGSLDGNDIYVKADGTIANNDGGTFDHFVPDKNPEFALIAARWDCDGYSWVYETDVPHESFDILEDGELYCKGVIFAVDDMLKSYEQGDEVWFIENGEPASARLVAQSGSCFVLTSTYLHCADFEEQLEEMYKESAAEGGVNVMLIEAYETYPSKNAAKEAIENAEKEENTGALS